MVTIEASSTGRCSLSGRECDGIVVTFADGSLRSVFLSWRSLQQLVKLKSEQVAASNGGETK